MEKIYFTMHIACGFGTEETVKFLIKNARKYYVDLNLRDRNVCTPFNHACFYGKLKIVKILLKNSKHPRPISKIDVIYFSGGLNEGQTLAEQKGHINVVNLIKDWKRKQTLILTFLLIFSIIFLFFNIAFAVFFNINFFSYHVVLYLLTIILIIFLLLEVMHFIF